MQFHHNYITFKHSLYSHYKITKCWIWLISKEVGNEIELIKNKRKEENEEEKEEENEQVNKISYSVVRIYELINFKINNKSNLLTNS